MKSKIYNYMELAGLFIVFVSVIVQFLLFNTINDLSSQAGLYRLEEKVDILVGMEINNNGGHLDIAKLNDNWIEINEKCQRIDEKKKHINNIYAVLVSLGALLFFLGKLMKIISNNHEGSEKKFSMV